MYVYKYIYVFTYVLYIYIYIYMRMYLFIYIQICLQIYVESLPFGAHVHNMRLLGACGLDLLHIRPVI